MANVVVILGAGASWDVSSGSGVSDVHWRPPLTSELFGDRARADFWNVLSRSEGAMNLYVQLHPLAVTNSLPLEQKLSEFANHKDPRVRESFKQLPPYISDVLFRCSTAYQYDNGTYRQLVHVLLAEAGNKVAFLVMNYDTLLEQAITAFDPMLSFRSMADYVADGRQALVYKLHGSVDWGRPIGTIVGGPGWKDQLRDLPLDQLTQRPVEFIPNRSEDTSAPVQLRGERWYWYPALTLPLADKSAADYVCPPEHVESLRRELATVSHVLIAGTSAQDPDVLSLLAETLPAKLTRVDVVTGGPRDEGIAVENRLLSGVRQFVHARETGALTTFPNGWSSYVNTRLSEFAQTAD